MTCNMLGGYQCFGGNCSLHLWPWTVGNQVQDSVVSYPIRPCHIMFDVPIIISCDIFSFLKWNSFSGILQTFHFLNYSGIYIWVLRAVWKWVVPPVHQLSALFDGFPVWLVWLEPPLLFTAPQRNGGVHFRYWHVISSWLIFTCLCAVQ
jgi:hypothetical protein